MKVFTVKKEMEEELSNKSREEVSSVKLCDKKEFNYIVIENPSDSNEICTIRNIKILSKDKNTQLCLMQGEEDRIKSSEEINITNKVGILNIQGGLKKCPDDEKIELSRDRILQNEECNILKDSVLIMLPKGCLFIKLDNEVYNLNIDINWTSEKIM
ncbi:MAG: hypothetical protein VB130_13920 [Clostridium sp.]|nr:hypothetical protein [Clostridium sp.]